MYKFVLKRLLMMIPVLLGVTFLVFFILALSPGDPARMILGEQATEESVQMMREELGLNDPIPVRYFRYMSGVLGDLGTSYRNKLDVASQVLDRFPNTVLLAVSGMLVAICIGVPVGILSAKRQYTLIDNIATVLGLVGVAMPTFWLGLLLVLFFSLTLRWFPSSGMGTGGVLPVLKSLVLPAITLGTSCTANIMRMTRSSMLEVIRQDYIDTTRSVGLTESANAAICLKCPCSHHYRCGFAVRLSAWRLGAYGNHLLVAGSRPPHGGFDKIQRHAYGLRLCDFSCGYVFHSKSSCGYTLCFCRPPHKVAV